MKHKGILLLLLLATLLAYQPAWNGGFLWDDDGHVTRADLRPASGLARIWFSPGAAQQYYPVVHSTFWVFHRMWGSDPVGYHLANIFLHAFSAYLLFVLLRRLLVPGALPAAFVFALHPVHVESVAWISELKNVLSGVFYLAAALVYLRYDVTRRRTAYAGALILFCLAVLSKTVTVTLPVGLVAVLWWRRGHLRTREDLLPLLPFMAIGLAAGLVTIWVERTMIGAQGSEFALGFVERCLLAARAVWFYAAKLAWPADLVFIYPRWTIDRADPAQWLYAVALATAASAVWLVRGRSRAPLAALMFFVVTLFPALGFFNVYPFRFSYVADHFQYLASIGPIVLASAGATMAARRLFHARVGAVAAGLVCAGLAGLTFAQSRQYDSAEALYRATIERNPSAWLARNNLAALLLEREPSEERIRIAITHLDAAIRLKPDYPEAHYNLGTAFERQGRIADAEAAYRRVLALDPGQPRALDRLAAIAHDRASAMLERGLALENEERLEEAETAYRVAVRFDPARAGIYQALGRVLQKREQRQAAIEAYQTAVSLDPSSFETHNDLGVLYAEKGDITRAVSYFEAAARLRPDDPAVRANLERARKLMGGGS